MSLSEFWKQLEQQAVPHVKAEVEKRGWRLTGAESLFFSASRNGAVWSERGDGPLSPHVRAMNVSDLIERIEQMEARIKRGLGGLDILFDEHEEES